MFHCNISRKCVVSIRCHTWKQYKTEINHTITMLPIIQNNLYISDIARMALHRLYVGYILFADHVSLSEERPEKKNVFSIATIGEWCIIWYVNLANG